MNKKELLRIIIDNQQLIIDSIIPNDIKEAILLHRATKAAKTFQIIIAKLIK
jgi:hypothetical protein